MRPPTRSPTPCVSPSRDCANASANPGSSPPRPESATASTLDETPGPREKTVDRAPGLSVRLKLTLSYAGFLMLAGAVLRDHADAYDTMLSRLAAPVAEQERFAANASHELRTPLAITQTLLDVARNDPDRDNGELVERLHPVNAGAIELTEALLLLSR